ncbi:MAG: hypothetical protein WD379_03245 [Dehalococcoidia bacterium]
MANVIEAMDSIRASLAKLEGAIPPPGIAQAMQNLTALAETHRSLAASYQRRAVIAEFHPSAETQRLDWLIELQDGHAQLLQAQSDLLRVIADQQLSMLAAQRSNTRWMLGIATVTLPIIIGTFLVGALTVI